MQQIYTDFDVNTLWATLTQAHNFTTCAGVAKPDVIVVSFPETYTPQVLVEVKEEEPEKTKRVGIVTTPETTEKAKHRRARALERMQSYLEIVSYTFLSATPALVEVNNPGRGSFPAKIAHRS